MLYGYNFSLEQVYKLMKDNMDYRGEEGQKRDAQILYYYLSEKLGLIGLMNVMGYMSDLLDATPVEIDKLMTSLGDYN